MSWSLQHALEGRHAAAAVRHLRDDLGRSVASGIVVRSGPPLPPVPLAPWQTEQLSANTCSPAAASPPAAGVVEVVEVGSSPACVAGRGRCARGDRAHRAVQREQPQAVAVRRAGQAVAAGVEGDVLVPVVLEDGRHVVGAGAGLELPQQVAGGGVVGLELAVVAAHERHVAGGRGRAGVAGLREVLVPLDGAGGGVDRRQVALVRPEAGDGDDAADELLALGEAGDVGGRVAGRRRPASRRRSCSSSGCSSTAASSSRPRQPAQSPSPRRAPAA